MLNNVRMEGKHFPITSRAHVLALCVADVIEEEWLLPIFNIYENDVVENRGESYIQEIFERVFLRVCFELAPKVLYYFAKQGNCAMIEKICVKFPGVRLTLTELHEVFNSYTSQQLRTAGFELSRSLIILTPDMTSILLDRHGSNENLNYHFRSDLRSFIFDMLIMCDRSPHVWKTCLLDIFVCVSQLPLIVKWSVLRCSLKIA